MKPGYFIQALAIGILVAPLLSTHNVQAAQPPDLMAAVLAGNSARVKDLRHSPGQVNVRDEDGNTALHWAALAGDASLVSRLLATGIDPRATNNAGATPLHYGVSNKRVVSLLLKAGADPNALSLAGNSPLHCACARPNSFAQVALLLEAGARVNAIRVPKAPFEQAETALSLAAAGGSEQTVNLLLDRGAVEVGTNNRPVANAAFAGQERVLKLLLARGESANCDDQFAGHALNIALYAGHHQLVSYLLEHGSDLHRKSSFGESVPPMVWSAYGEQGDPAVAKALLDRGLDVHEASSSGSTALSWALKRGETPLVALLRSRGATEVPPKRKSLPNNPVPQDPAGREHLLRAGVQRALDLLQRSSDGFLDNGFVKQSGCVSCHQQTLPAVAFALAEERGFKLDEASLARQLSVQQAGWSKTRDQAYELHAPQPAPAAVIGYGLHGLHALRYQPDKLTAAMGFYLAETQLPDGSWPDYDVRPPMEEGQVVGTALTLKALQFYPPSVGTQPLKRRIAKARHWLEQSKPATLNQRVYRYHGLVWAGATASELQRESKALLALQRPDGGWAPLPGLESDSWATGHTLTALHEAGALASSHPAYQRGIDFLLRTQFEDGSWWVKSRTWPFQPHFDSGFPHGKDQWISAGGTAWAAIALLNALEPVARRETFPTAQVLLARHSKPASASPHAQPEAAELTSAAGPAFTRDVFPIFQKSCVDCHSGEKPKGGLSLETPAGLLMGGRSGEPAVVRGQPEASPLLRLVQDKVEDLEMPPLGKRGKFPALTQEQIETLRGWIRDGAR